ncbi:hypothetical protein MBLNU457_7096t1 [Dothideomycetes sp. NU457]
MPSLRLIIHNLRMTSRQGTLHSLFPMSSRNHCAPLITPVSCPPNLLTTPSTALRAASPAPDCNICAADSTTALRIGFPYVVVFPVVEASSGAGEKTLFRGSNQSDRQS